MKIDQVSSANTFEEWLLTTSSLIAVANNLTDNTNGGFLANSSIFIEGANSSLNVRTLANINTLRANTGNIANTNIDGSNVSIALDLTVGRNLSTDEGHSENFYVIGILVEPNAAFNQANSQFVQSNSLYIHANSAFIHANAEFNQTNVSFIHANSGFIQANSVYLHTNYAFNHANSGFIQTNSAFYHANSDFIQINAAFDHVNSGFIHANSQFIKINVANVPVEHALIHMAPAFNNANSGFIQTNSAFDHANATFNRSNSVFIRANNSLDANNGGTVTGAVTILAVDGVKSQNGVLEDSIELKGRSGGSASYDFLLTSGGILTVDKTVEFPDSTFEVGFRNVPISRTLADQNATINPTEIGKFIEVSDNAPGFGQTYINIPNYSTQPFSNGDVVIIVNNSSANVGLTYGVTAYKAGKDTIITSANILPKGVATVMFLEPNYCITSGIT